jgi:hypothetical protein
MDGCSETLVRDDGHTIGTTFTTEVEMALEGIPRDGEFL